MERMYYVKENGVVRIVDEATIEEKKKQAKDSKNNGSNICGDCAYGYAHLCPKMEYGPKKFIGDYEYITDGFQIYDTNGEDEVLAITGCTNFSKEQRQARGYTERKRLSDSLLILFAGGETTNEALAILDYSDRCARAREEAEEQEIEERGKTR